ncbi:MICOS complex subunit Mic60-like isoform X2 [Anthonomus grandis grandis]|uniref:MICOS complex subunit Mic60-like isoform X2 n=1 Tax=Anthonomus grandis grandis TaxID=2921223 RepID=UPI002165ABDB|nr:MICOS complex subunit Mic60-like isoform X2 [Anthonomus grandis grandis]
MFEFLYQRGKIYGVRVSESNANNELSFHDAPALWCASQSLKQAIKWGSPGIPWKNQMRPLHKELGAMMSAVSHNDELARVVINGVPKEAFEREEALKQRFNEVDKLARKVDLVPAKGAPLLVHILSYLQSILLIKSASYISQSELNDEEIDFNKLSTHDILYRARFWLDRGDLTQALKYMNLLQGAPRVVARQWIHEAKILLETEQAANLLMAYAISCGLKYL